MMNDEPLGHELKAQVLTLLCCNLPREAKIGRLEDLADQIVQEIQEVWKSRAVPAPAADPAPSSPPTWKQ